LSQEVQPEVWAPGTAGVDIEQRVDFDRLRTYRQGRARQAIRDSGLAALLCFDVNNIRYLTSTAIGEWSRDKMTRYALFTAEREPILWDFGSAAVYHRLHSPWISPENSRGAWTLMRGAISPDGAVLSSFVTDILHALEEVGVDRSAPIGIDMADIAVLRALEDAGLTIVDGQQTMLAARELKSPDEVTLLTQAAAMVDGAYYVVADILRPGVRENEVVAAVNEYLYRLGSEDVESVNAVSGERCIPHPHNFSDRLIRPREQVFFDIMHAYNGYRTCYYRCFAVGKPSTAQTDSYKRARQWMDTALDMIKPGITTDEIARTWPTAEEIGLANEREAFGLEFGHGLGLALHERPIISRLNSLEQPQEIKPGMVFAVETYCPASDGRSAARIEEEVVVGEADVTIITRFPSEELFVVAG